MCFGYLCHYYIKGDFNVLKKEGAYDDVCVKRNIGNVQTT